MIIMTVIEARNHRGKKEVLLSSVISCKGNDDSVVIYTNDGEFMINNKLYEIDQLERFIRISKSCVVNITKIKDASPIFNSRIRLKMINGNVEYVNRTYIKVFKDYLKGGVDK